MQFSVERRSTGEEQEKIRENSSDSISEILVEMKKKSWDKESFSIRSSALLSHSLIIWIDRVDLILLLSL